jgi:hypothetical protein
MTVTSGLALLSSRRLICAGLLLSFTSVGALADDRCRQLEDLNRQYAGVQLTSYQKDLKRQLVAWYNTNCRGNRRAAHEARNSGSSN